jgi:hypothetical protein
VLLRRIGNVKNQYTAALPLVHVVTRASGLRNLQHIQDSATDQSVSRAVLGEVRADTNRKAFVLVLLCLKCRQCSVFVINNNSAFDLCMYYLICVRPCFFNVGNSIKTNKMQQITVFIDLQDQLNMFRTKLCPSSERKTANYSVWYSAPSLQQAQFR